MFVHLPLKPFINTSMAKQSKLLTLLLSLALLPLIFSCESEEMDPQAKGNLTGTIVYESVTNGIMEYDTRTRKNTVIIEDGFQPQRLSSGETFHVVGRDNGGMFTATGQMAIMSPDHLSRTVLFDLGDESFYEPQISPDGNFVAFSYVTGAFPELYKQSSGTVVVNRDGTFHTAFDSTNYPAWTSDNRLVVAGTYRYGSWGSTVEGNSDQPGLYVSNTDLTELSLITTTINGPSPKMPAVSSDNRIAFIMNKNLWVIHLDGSGLQQLTNSETELSYPTWSPDGNYIAVVGGVPRPPYTGRAAAIAAIPSNLDTPLELTDESEYYIRTHDGDILNGWKQMSWK